MAVSREEAEAAANKARQDHGGGGGQAGAAPNGHAAPSFEPMPLIANETFFERPPDREQLIEGLIPSRCCTGVYGHGGVSKSRLMQEAATCVATGRDYYGLPVLQAPTLCFFAEDEEEEFRRRQYWMTRRYALRPQDLPQEVFAAVACDEIPNAEIMTEDPKTGGVMLTELAHRIRVTAKQHKSRLIQLDNIALVYGANEIVRRQVTEFLRFNNRWAVEQNGAVVLIGHPALNRAEGNVFSGSTGWNNGLRNRVEICQKKVTEEGEEDTGEAKLTVSVAKSNYLPSPREVLKLHKEADGKIRLDDPAYQSAADRFEETARRQKAKDVVVSGIETLWERGLNASHSPQARDSYFARLLQGQNLTNGLSEKQLKDGLNAALEDGTLKAKQELGRNKQRHPVYGLATAGMGSIK